MQNYLNIKHFLSVFTILLFLLGCSYEDPTIQGVKSLKVNKLTPQGFGVAMQLKVHNPNDYNLKIKDIDLDVTIGGVVLGSITDVDKIVLRKNTNSELDFDFWVNFKQGGAAMLTSLAMKGLGKGNQLKLSGHVKAGNSWITKKFPVEIKENLSLNTILKG